jgi:hypothetical protein
MGSEDRRADVVFAQGDDWIISPVDQRGYRVRGPEVDAKSHDQSQMESASKARRRPAKVRGAVLIAEKFNALIEVV